MPYTVWTFSFLTRECEEELQRAQVALATPHRPTWKSTTPWRLKQSMPHRFRALPVILEILKSSFQMDRDFLANRHVSEKAASRVFVSRTDLPGRRLLNELLHHSGSGIYEGRGGASKNVNGVDIWLVGTPPRKFRIIGYITDSRPGGAIPMARRDADLEAEAKKSGGDGILLKAEQTDFLGTYSTGNATAITSGNVTTAVGSGVSVPIIRREGQYFVIKYVN